MAHISQCKRGDIVQIEWGDAYNSSGWRDSDDKDCAPEMVTCIAAVAVVNKKGVVLTFGFSGKKNIGEMFIPTGMITKVKILIKSKQIKESY